MTRTPAALALLFALSGTRTVRAEPCAPRAVLGGDRDAVEKVGVELVKLGVALSSGSARCPAVQAQVELAREGGINVAVRGSAQRSEGRLLSDPEVAAMWIDAWVRDDLEVASWAPEAPLGAPSVSTPRDAPAGAAQVAHRSVLEDLGIAALYEQAWTDDSTSWQGGHLAACVRVAGLCIGGRVRALVQPDQVANLTMAARSDVSAFATASMPIAAGQTILAPELGLGIGRFSTRRIDGCAPAAMPPPNCDPTDPMCVMDPATGCTDASGTAPGGKLYVGDELENATYTPRITLALRISVPLFHHVWLDGLASYTLMPFGHTQPFAPEKPSPMTPAGQVDLPGEPGAGWIVGVGLRLGAP